MDATRAQRILRQHLLTDHLFGVNAVPTSGLVVSMPKVQPEPQSSLSGSVPLSQNRESFGLHDPSSNQAAPHLVTDEAKLVWSAFTIPNIANDAPLEPDAKQQLLDEMNQQEVANCEQCELCHSRTQSVFGEGSVTAKLMFVGEGPGRDEDLQGRPFVGKSGGLLDKMIVAMGFNRQDVFIANVVKCRPPSNRTPSIAQAHACGGYLLRQIAIIEPKVIVTLGGSAANLLLNTSVGITKIRGQWHTFDALKPHGPSIDVMPTFHPAYLLRSYTKDNREKVWKDLQAVIARLQNT